MDPQILEKQLSKNTRISKVQHIQANLILQKRIFYGGAGFGKCNFTKDVDFSKSLFNSSLSFLSANFSKNASFSRGTFSDAVFKDSSFFGEADLSDCKFKKQCNFLSSDFHGNFIMSGTEFLENADFSLSKFLNDVDFKNSKFSKKAEFVGVRFEKNADFSGCIFNESLNLRKSIFNGTTSFTDSDINGNLLAEEAHFNDALNLNRTKYKNIYIKWDNVGTVKYNETAYYLLISNFKNLGLFSDANKCYYDFMSEMANQSKYQTFAGRPDTFLPSFVYLFAKELYGFGTKPELPLIYSTALILFFALIWHFKYLSSSTRSGNIYDRYGSAKNGNKALSSNGNLYSGFLRFINALTFSINIFLSGTKLFVDPPEMPKRTKGSQIWMNRIYLLE